jgi:NADH:ubiquinone oxidoreductase subunit 3 (subunit A)
MTFLVFDVEIIFLYPWAVTFAKLAPRSPEAAPYLGRIAFFIATSIIAYIDAWRKGVFRRDEVSACTSACQNGAGEPKARLWSPPAP